MLGNPLLQAETDIYLTIVAENKKIFELLENKKIPF